MLYHVNIGFPAVDADSELLSPSHSVTPRDEAAADGADRAHLLDGPTAGYHEKAYFHDLGTDAALNTGTAIVNRRLGFGVYLKFNRAQLPHFCQWKMMGQRNYVVGMEPCNALPLGRDVERREGRLQFLEPRESREYELEIGALTSAEEIAGFEAQVAAWRG